MATTTVYGGTLYWWLLELEDGTQRNVLVPSATSAVAGLHPSPVVSAERGAAYDPVADMTPPALTGLIPTSAALGSANFTLQVQGTGFRPGDVILWNGMPEPTTYVSATELTTAVNMATAEVAMTIPVTVQNVLGMVSNALPFDLTSP